MLTVSIDDQTVRTGKWVRLVDVLTVSGADAGGVLRYELWDGAGSNSFWVGGAGVVDASAGYTIDAAALANTWFQGDSSPGWQTLWVRAFDSSGASAWDPFVLTTTPNSAPTASVADQSIAANAEVQLASVLSTSDFDGDSIARYEVWDSLGGDNWLIDGTAVDASSGYATTDLSSISFRGDTSSGSQTLWVRVNDGIDWGAWESFTLTTQNSAPVADMPDQRLKQLEWVRLITVLDVDDADGDPGTLYEIWDSEGGDNWWADGGTVDASAGYRTTDLGGIWFQGDAAPGAQTLWVRVNDGTEWGAWEPFVVTTLNTVTGTSAADDLNGTGDADIIEGLAGADDLNGKAGDDILRGGDGADNIRGGKGDDTLRGGDGFDFIWGEGGDDRLFGGDDGGPDNLNGGLGADTFVFVNGDILIRDFLPETEGDVVEIDRDDVNSWSDLKALIDDSSYVDAIEFGGGDFLTFDSAFGGLYQIDALEEGDFVFV